MTGMIPRFLHGGPLENRPEDVNVIYPRISGRTSPRAQILYATDPSGSDWLDQQDLEIRVFQSRLPLETSRRETLLRAPLVYCPNSTDKSHKRVHRGSEGMKQRQANGGRERHPRRYKPYPTGLVTQFSRDIPPSMQRLTAARGNPSRVNISRLGDGVLQRPSCPASTSPTQALIRDQVSSSPV